MGTRLELQNKLEELLGSRHVYFQPPESVKMEYPAIKYSMTSIKKDKADNTAYLLTKKYSVVAAPSAADYQSVNDSPEAATMSWEISTTPVSVAGFKPTATLVFDSTKLSEKKMAAIEKVLYGDADTEARLPLPDEVKTIITAVTE